MHVLSIADSLQRRKPLLRISLKMPDHSNHPPAATAVYNEEDVCFTCISEILEKRMPKQTQLESIEKVLLVLQNSPSATVQKISHYLFHSTTFIDSAVSKSLLLFIL